MRGRYMNTRTPEREKNEKELGSASGVEAQSQPEPARTRARSARADDGERSGSKRNGGVHGLVGWPGQNR